MILEAAMLHIRNGQSQKFEAAFAQAQSIIATMPGYLGHELQRCIEVEGKYLLLVRWRSVDDHEIGFRQSPEYQEWKRLLHHFYEPFPIVEHFRLIYTAASLRAASAPEHRCDGAAAAAQRVLAD
jgi:heme-degrading monooxygenase HmoA